VEQISRTSSASTSDNQNPYSRSIQGKKNTILEKYEKLS
jgi:hypothetical protein